MESFHLSVARAVNDGIFKGLRITSSSSLSHIFYADDTVFIGEWSIENLDNLLKILNCFHLASGLCINVNKSHVLGVSVPLDIVRQGALRIGCEVMQTPLKYLGVMVKTLSIGGRLTLLKSVLGAVLIYNMSLFKAPKCVLHELERLRNNFFKGGDSQDSKITWVAWVNVLSSKKNEGLGVSSFFALNRALLLKWVWRYLVQDGSLWYHIISVIYGSRLECHSRNTLSPWGVILREVHQLASKGFNFHSHCKIRVGDGLNTRFWFDTWILDLSLNVRFPRLFALELDKDISVAAKWSAPSFDASFRRQVRDGVERNQWSALLHMLSTITLSSSSDRYFCDLNDDGAYRVKDIRSELDDLFLHSSAVANRWVNLVPIKVNIFTWRVSLDRLPTRGNLISRGVTLDSPLCPICELSHEDSSHLFFSCELGKSISQRICRWRNIQWEEVSSFVDWFTWFGFIRLPSKIKAVLEGVFYSAWWHVWSFRNKLIFDSSPPRRSVIFDDLVSASFNWHLSDHRPILLREFNTDYGATPFRLFHSWFDFQGFDDMITQTWNPISLNDSNAMVRFKKKLQALKKVIRLWIGNYKRNQMNRTTDIK
nr:RNA-directed DNA polymerase, eukaryota [Tanacetum cinerariifolium]